MIDQGKFSSLKQRLDAIVEALSSKLDALKSGQGTPDGPVGEADAIDQRARALRDRIPDGENEHWQGIAHEVERDLHALEKDFNHWLEYIDQHYNKQS